MIRGGLAFLVLWGTAASASPDARLTAAISAHQNGEFERAREELTALLSDASLSEPERIKAREYLASTFLALKDETRASATLEALLLSHRETHLDPDIFVAELVVLMETVRTRLERERPPPALTVAPVQAQPGASRWAWIPAAAGVALGGVAVATGMTADGKDSQLRGTPTQTTLRSDPTGIGLYQDGKNLQIATWACGVAGGALVAVGGALFLLGKQPALTVGATGGPGGARVFLEGTLP